MSEVTTLKQLMLDAARWRGLCEMIDCGDYWLTRRDYSVAISSDGVGKEIDAHLDSE